MLKFTAHKFYPGVTLVVSGEESILFGVPNDAFKATKQYCTDHKLPFPRTLVAPPRMVVMGTPQFNPEFFLYDFLFVYGAAFKPQLANERLRLVMPSDRASAILKALRLTLTGPTLSELESYTDAAGNRAVPQEDAEYLTSIADFMAIKQGDQPRPLETMVESITFDAGDLVTILDGDIKLRRDENGFEVIDRTGQSQVIDFEFPEQVIPFSTLPRPLAPETPMSLGVKPLGARSGFDLSGPCTGFLIWVNGRIVLYDGPVATRFLLTQLGLGLEDIDVVILSHCHEDHMGAFVELITSGRKPKFITGEPVYRATLDKLASFFGKPADEVAELLDYQPVDVGQPFDCLGANFELFYTVHSIPTVGLRVEVKDEFGETHGVVISGDTLHHEGLEKLHQEGLLPQQHLDRMKHLVPDTRRQRHVYFCDVGESIIHGHPKDWVDHDNRVVYYHCPDNEYTRSFNRELAIPGKTLNILSPRRLHPMIPLRVQSVLSHLGLDNESLHIALAMAASVEMAAVGEHLCTHETTQDLFIIVSGSARVKVDDHPSECIGPGDYFSSDPIFWDTQSCSQLRVTAETPLEFIRLGRSSVNEALANAKARAILEERATNKLLLDQVPSLKSLSYRDRLRLAEGLQRIELSANDGLSQDNNPGLYFLLEGEVDAISIEGKTCRVSQREDRGILLQNQHKLGVAELRTATGSHLVKVGSEQVDWFLNTFKGIAFNLAQPS